MLVELFLIIYAISALSLILQQSFGNVKISDDFSIVFLSLIPVVNTLLLIKTIVTIRKLNKSK